MSAPHIRVKITETIVYERTYTLDEITSADTNLAGMTELQVVEHLNVHGDVNGPLHEDMERDNEVISAVTTAALV